MADPDGNDVEMDMLQGLFFSIASDAPEAPDAQEGHEEHVMLE